MKLPLITPRQARCLAGSRWNFGGEIYTFGKKPLSGGEAFLYPLVNESNQVAAYARFLLNSSANTRERFERTQWLMGQQLHKRSSVFRAAPYAWLSTFELGRPPGCPHDFVATIHAAVPGRSWRSIKQGTESNQGMLSDACRVMAAKTLIAHLATMEFVGPEGFIHGDVSDGNFLIDAATKSCHLIDYDAFVYTTSSLLRYPRLTVEMGGAKGTPGYMPPALEESTAEEAFPYSDKFGRDMLLIELLAFQPGDPALASPRYWSEFETTLVKLEQLARPLGLTHLLDPSVFVLDESERPSSKELAIAAGCRMPGFSNPKPPSKRPVRVAAKGLTRMMQAACGGAG